MNTEILRSMLGKFKSGAYEKNRDEFTKDIKSDFSLFAHFLRSLGKLTQHSMRDTPPLELVDKLELENLRKVLEEADEHLSYHTFDPRMKPQMARVKQMLVAGSVAEALGEKEGFESDTVLSCSIARQLGMMLVAFNYPRIYTQALQSLKPGSDDLEKNLKRTLGFSPTQLGVKLALGWSTNPEVKISTGQEELVDADTDPLMVYRNSDEAHQRGEQLRKICEISDTVAQLTDTDHFPASAGRWNTVLIDLKRRLGTDALQIVEQRLNALSGSYAKLNTDIFDFSISPEESVRATNSQYSQKLFEENSFLKKVESEVRDRFKQVYDRIVMGQVSTDGLTVLVGEVIPSAGFVKGCVFLADANHRHLVPMLRIGRAQLSEFKALNIEDSGKVSHPAVDALHVSTPIRQEGVVVSGEVVSHITGSFGNSSKTGVLYLQMSKALAESDRELSLTFFKAVRQCLSDCLALRGGS